MKAASVSHPPSERGAHTVVLGCAKAQRGYLAPLVEALSAQEHHVELVSGIDESRQRWREAGQRYGTRAVYVACGGPALPPAELATLRNELRSLGIPSSSVWTGVVDWTKIDRLIRDIERMTEAPRTLPPPPPMSMHAAKPSAVLPPLPSIPTSAPPAPPRPVAVPSPDVPVRIAQESSAPSIAAATVGPVPPPPPTRLAPMGPGFGLSGGPAPRSPQSIDDHATSSLDGVDPFIELRGRSIRRWALAMGTVATLGLMLVVGLGASSEGDSSLVAEAAAKETTETMAEPEPSASTPVAANPRPVPIDAAGPSGLDPATADPATEDPATEDPATEDRPGTNAGSTPKAGPAPEPSLAANDDELIHAALMQRKIRALDILLVSPEATRKVRRRTRVSLMSWANAQTYCEGLDIEGVKGWRLPSAGEFRTLSGSNMLERRSYWSSTEADAFGSDRVVWNNHKKAMAPASGDWKGGRVLCVRFQHPEGFAPT